jgi:hypothetical protein
MPRPVYPGGAFFVKLKFDNFRPATAYNLGIPPGGVVPGWIKGKLKV